MMLINTGNEETEKGQGMGREVRMVPPNWEHPKISPEHDRYNHGGLQPMYDQHFDDAFADWLENFDQVRTGKLDDIEKECYPNGLSDWLQDEGLPPVREYYRPYKDEDATWFQVWETVSEGTPVTPPFETKDELIEYLASHGDFWDQARGDGPWLRSNAKSFVDSEWAPSMIMEITPDGASIKTARDGI